MAVPAGVACGPYAPHEFRPLQYEKEADAFYHKLVSELPKQDQPLFDKFLGIEDSHLALVHAQFDAVQGRGFWFDIAAFIQDG